MKRLILTVAFLFTASVASAHGGRTFSRGYGGHHGVGVASYGHCNAVLQVPFVPTVAYYQPVQVVQYVQPVVQYVQQVQQVQYVQQQVQPPYIPPVQQVQEVQQPIAVQQTYAAPQVAYAAAPVCPCPVPLAFASPCYGASYAGSFAYSAFRSRGFGRHHGFINSGFVRSRSNGGNFQGRGGNIQVNVPGVGISSRGGFVRSRR